MTNPTETPSDEFAILVDWIDGSGTQRAGLVGDAQEKIQAEAKIAVARAMDTIDYMAHQVAQTLNGLKDKTRPNEAEVQFGITLDAQAGALLSSAGVGAQLTVKLKWNVEQPERVQVLLKE